MDLTVHLCLVLSSRMSEVLWQVNTLNAKLNPICHLLALLGAHLILHVSRIRVNVFLELFFHSIFISSNSRISAVVTFRLVKTVRCLHFFKLQNGDWIQMAQKIVPSTVVWNYGITGTSDVKP